MNIQTRFLTAVFLTALALPSLAQETPPAAVELGRVIEGDSASVLRLPGTVISTRDALISAELDGRLTWVAEVGQQLAAGDAIATIDDHLLQLQLRDDNAQIERIKADIDYNQRQGKRLQRLATKNNTAQSELDQLRSRLAMLVQDLKVAEVDRDRTLYNLQRSSVRAPFPGVIVSRELSGGEYTLPGQALVRLVDTRSLEVSVNAPLRAAGFNQAGAALQVESNREILQAPIRAVVPVGDSRSRMLELRLTLEPGAWHIGEAVTVELPDGPSNRALLVPRDALVLRGDMTYVYTVAGDSTAVRVGVKTGAGAGDLIAVTGKLLAGDAVVVRGAERLKPGQVLKEQHPKLATNS